MADNIIKLRVDSSEYDSKIKRAAQGLQALGQNLRSAGKTFADADKDAVKFAQELGKMQTVSNTAKGKIGEMSAAFVNLKSQYLQMTEAEKQSPIGQAMAKSLEQLKQRTIEAKKELADLNNELQEIKMPEISKDGGGLFDSDKISGMLQVFGGNLMTKGFTMAAGAVTSFAAEIGDAVKQGIELAKSGEGVRIAFERLNQPGLLDNLREATHGTVTDLELMKAAVKFSDFKLPVEELGTMLAFAQQKAKDTGQSVDYMVDSIVTGLGRKSMMILDNLGLSAAEIKEKMGETGDMTKAVGEIIRDQMSKSGDYIETAADRATAAQVDLQNAMEELGRTLLPLKEQSTSLWTELEIGALKFLNDGIKPLVPGIIELKNEIGDLYDTVVNNPWTSGFLDWLETGLDISSRFLPVISKIRILLDGLKKSGNTGDMGASVGASIFGDHIYEIPEVEVSGTRPQKKKPKAKTSNSTEDIQEKIMKQWVNAFTKSASMTESFKATEDNGPSSIYQALKDQHDKIEEVDLQTPLQKLEEELKALTAYRDSSMTKEEWQSRNASVKAKEKEIKDYKGEGDKESKGLLKNTTHILGSINGSINDMINGLEGLGIEIGDGFRSILGPIQTIISILSAIQTVETVGKFLGVFNSGGIVPHAAQGYFVQGNTYSGDTTPILANAGELILDKASQGNLASQLQQNEGGGGGLVGVITGEQIHLVHNRYLKRSGQGELVTW